MSAPLVVTDESDPAAVRDGTVFVALTEAMLDYGVPLPPTPIRAAITSAVLEALADGGYLAPLPGEQDKRLTDLLGEVEHRLDTKGVTRR